MQFLRSIYIIWLRDMLRYWRNRVRLISSIAMPLLWLVIFGSGMKGSLNFAGPEMAASNFDYLTFLFPGVIGMTVLFTSVFSAISIVTDREFGFLKEILVAPISRTSIALGKILSGSTTAVIQGLIIVAIAPLVGIKLSFLLVLALIPAIFLVAFALSSLGLLIASRIKSTEGFPMVINFIMMPMFFLSGAMFPLVNLPTWMSFVSKINPASYAIDMFRQIAFSFMSVPTMVSDFFRIKLFGQPVTLFGDIAIVVGFGLVMVILSTIAFKKSEN
ncbi:MAG: ABC transporter permease [Patescibacteria group bacterium]|nr:ABC transporter permease [Patescibacteria group bacterium]